MSVSGDGCEHCKGMGAVPWDEHSVLEMRPCGRCSAWGRPPGVLSVEVTRELLDDLRDGRAVYVCLEASVRLGARLEVECEGEAMRVEVVSARQGQDVSGRYPTLVREVR